LTKGQWGKFTRDGRGIGMGTISLKSVKFKKDRRGV